MQPTCVYDASYVTCHSKKKKKKKHFTFVFQAQLGLLDGIFNAISYMFAAATRQEASLPWEKLALWPTPPKFTHSQCHKHLCDPTCTCMMLQTQAASWLARPQSVRISYAAYVQPSFKLPTIGCGCRTSTLRPTQSHTMYESNAQSRKYQGGHKPALPSPIHPSKWPTPKARGLRGSPHATHLPAAPPHKAAKHST